MQEICPWEAVSLFFICCLVEIHWSACFFSCQRRTWILSFCPLHHLAQPPVLFTPLHSQTEHPTPYPSLQACTSTASFLVLFLSVGPELLEQVLKVEQVTSNQPFGEGCQCRNAALWLSKATARFGSIRVLWADKLLESELSLSSETSCFLMNVPISWYVLLLEMPLNNLCAEKHYWGEIFEEWGI